MHMISTLNAAVTSQVCEAKHLTALFFSSFLHSNLELNSGSNSDCMWRHWKISSMDLSNILKYSNAVLIVLQTYSTKSTVTRHPRHPSRTTWERRKGSLEGWFKFMKQHIETCWAAYGISVFLLTCGKASTEHAFSIFLTTKPNI